MKHCIAWLSLLICFGIVILFGFWNLYPYKPLTFKNEKILNPQISRGEHLNINVDYCKNMNLPSTMYVTFVDGVVYNTIPVYSNLPTGCHNITLQIYVPKALTTGEMKVKVMYRYKVNPIRNVDVEGTSEVFTIIK